MRSVATLRVVDVSWFNTSTGASICVEGACKIRGKINIEDRGKKKYEVI